jgi:hypothetical protein
VQSSSSSSFSAFCHPQSIFYGANARAVLNATMSFGFSIGDFITVIELANKVRKEFVHAPSQFKAISDEYAALTTI